jgi:flagellar biogenesis protein FliO
VGRIHLSPKVVVYFLRIVDQLLVVGTNAGDVSLLMTIIDEHEIAQIEDALKGAYKSGSGSTFSRLFDKSMAKFQKTLEREDSIFDDQLRSLNEQIGRLRGLARKKEKHDE